MLFRSLPVRNERTAMTIRIELPTEPPCLARREPVPMKTLAWTWIVVVVPVVSGQTGLRIVRAGQSEDTMATSREVPLHEVRVVQVTEREPPIRDSQDAMTPRTPAASLVRMARSTNLMLLHNASP